MNHRTHDITLHHSLIFRSPALDHGAVHRADVLAARRRDRRRRTRTWARTFPETAAGRPTSVGGER